MKRLHKSIKRDKVRYWGTDIPTYIEYKGELYDGIAYTYSKNKPTSIPTYYDSITGKRFKYSKVVRKKIKGVWVTYVQA